MSGKWTPGPWKVALTNPRRIMNSDNIIAEIEDDLRGPDAAGQMSANARLISQSPVLFDALAELYSSARELLVEAARTPGRKDLTADELEARGFAPDSFAKARAALAKAKGEGA